MSKNAVYHPPSLSMLADDNYLKRIALLFDKIYLSHHHLNIITQEQRIEHQFPDYLWERYVQDMQLHDYLQEKGVISIFDETMDPNRTIYTMETLPESKKELIEIWVALLKQMGDFEKQSATAGTIQELEQLRLSHQEIFNESDDISTRLDTMKLTENTDEEFYPILKTMQSYHTEGKKSKVVRFILNNMPEPDIALSWDRIIEFRSDEATRVKYFALLNWINEIVNSNLTVNEIKEKYEYLFLDYKTSYERHKLKSTFGTMEIIAGATAAFFSGNLPAMLTLASKFFKIGVSSLNFLKEEKILPGKELAYIYHAQKKLLK